MPLERVLGPEVGAIYADLHREHGVDLLSARRHSRRFEGDGRVERVRLADGDADRLRLRRRRRRRRRRGPRSPRRPGIDGRQRRRSSTSSSRRASPASSRPATSPTPTTRSTASGCASSTGRTRSTRARPPRGDARQAAGVRRSCPYFFSDQYDVGMEYTGYATRVGRGRVPRRPAAREFIAFWLRDGPRGRRR